MKKILEEHRKSCEQQGKYVEADIAKNRLLEIKAHEESRQKEAMRARQIGEMLGIEETHMLEFQQFNSSWDAKMKENENKAEGLISIMKERHEKEFEEFQTKLQSKQQKPKFSTELLNYRKIEEHLVKSKDYNEAHKTKVKADELESIETERWIKRKRKDMARQENQFKHTKQQELSALLKRIQAGKEEQKKQRKIALERLLQRYQNIKKELEAQQNLERINREKQLTSGSSTGRYTGGSIGRRDSMKSKKKSIKR